MKKKKNKPSASAMNSRLISKPIRRCFPIFMLPTFIAFCIGFIWPFIQGLYLSFCKFTTTQNEIFIGLENYVKALQDPTIKHAFEGTETILEIAEKINEAIQKETTNRVGENGTDKLARVLTMIPSPILRFVVNTLMWMDRHNLLPKFIIDLSPFHTSFFITNLKSLGINHVFHHTYEFGTTGLFFAIGKEKAIPVMKKGEVVEEKHMPFSLVSDERFCDGLYFALALREFRKMMRNPATLEEPLEKKIEDDK